MENYIILKELGKGAFSTVYKVLRKETKIIYAMKSINMTDLSEKEKENSINEIRILASIDSKFIVSYIEAFYSNEMNTLNIVMEYCDNKDLENLIEEQRKGKSVGIQEREIWNYLYQIVVGVKCLHDNQILHRDIKSANILLNSNGDVKIGDLNVSKLLKIGMLQTQTGTPYYASPEVWRDMPYDYKSDVWSIGCVLYEMCNLCPPFKGATLQEVYKKVCKGVFPPISRLYSKELSSLIGVLLKVNPNERPTVNGILLILSKHHNSKVININNYYKENLHHNKRISEDKFLKTIRIPNQLSEINNILPKSKLRLLSASPASSRRLLKPLDFLSVNFERKEKKKKEEKEEGNINVNQKEGLKKRILDGINKYDKLDNFNFDMQRDLIDGNYKNYNVNEMNNIYNIYNENELIINNHKEYKEYKPGDVSKYNNINYINDNFYSNPNQIRHNSNIIYINNTETNTDHIYDHQQTNINQYQVQENGGSSENHHIKLIKPSLISKNLCKSNRNMNDRGVTDNIKKKFIRLEKETQIEGNMMNHYSNIEEESRHEKEMKDIREVVYKVNEVNSKIDDLMIKCSVNNRKVINDDISQRNKSNSNKNIVTIENILNTQIEKINEIEGEAEAEVDSSNEGEVEVEGDDNKDLYNKRRNINSDKQKVVDFYKKINVVNKNSNKSLRPLPLNTNNNTNTNANTNSNSNSNPNLSLHHKNIVHSTTSQYENKPNQENLYVNSQNYINQLRKIKETTEIKETYERIGNISKYKPSHLSSLLLNQNNNMKYINKDRLIYKINQDKISHPLSKDYIANHANSIILNNKNVNSRNINRHLISFTNNNQNHTNNISLLSNIKGTNETISKPIHLTYAYEEEVKRKEKIGLIGLIREEKKREYKNMSVIKEEMGKDKEKYIIKNYFIRNVSSKK